MKRANPRPKRLRGLPALAFATATLLVLFALAFGPSAFGEDSADDIEVIWMPTGDNSACRNGGDCVELCLRTPRGPQPTGLFCCVEPHLVYSTDPNACRSGFRL